MNSQMQYRTTATRLLDRVASVVGLHPILLPAGQQDLFKRAGLDQQTIERILREVHSMRSWPATWQKEAEKQASLGMHMAAFLCYYMAQRVLIHDSDFKSELYLQAQNHYLLMPQTSALERVEIDYVGGRAVGYLQMPYRAQTKPVPLIVISPGITVTKEELHYWAEPFLKRNFAVLRIDNPGGYGETQGLVNEETVFVAADFVNHLKKDPRIDADRISLLGFSLGGFFALHAARRADVHTVTTIGAPFNPSHYVHKLPPLNLLALKRIIGIWDTDKLQLAMEANDLKFSAHEITGSCLAIHGARDATIPPREALAIALSTKDPNGFWLFPREAHSCIGAVPDIVGLKLLWEEDPARFLKAHPNSDLQRWPWLKLLTTYPHQKALTPLANRFAQALFAPGTWHTPTVSTDLAVYHDVAPESSSV